MPNAFGKQLGFTAVHRKAIGISIKNLNKLLTLHHTQPTVWQKKIANSDIKIAYKPLNVIVPYICST
jgi:hypothetical protein